MVSLDLVVKVPLCSIISVSPCVVITVSLSSIDILNQEQGTPGALRHVGAAQGAWRDLRHALPGKAIGFRVESSEFMVWGSGFHTLRRCPRR